MTKRSQGKIYAILLATVFLAALLSTNINAIKANKPKIDKSQSALNISITDPMLKLAVVRSLVMQKLIRVPYQDPVAEPSLDLVDAEIAKDIKISRDLANRVRILKLEKAGVSNLQGLENFTNLRSLNLSCNQISDLKPLENLTDITYLNLANNKITSIKNLKNFVNLTELNLQNNQISDISVIAQFSQLTELDIAHNKIWDLTPLKEILPNLSDLATNDNNLQYQANESTFTLPFKLPNDTKVTVVAKDKAEQVKISGNTLELQDTKDLKNLELTYSSDKYGRKLYKKDNSRTYQGKISVDLSQIKHTASKPENKPKQTEKQEQAEPAEKDNELSEKPKPTKNSKPTENNKQTEANKQTEGNKQTEASKPTENNKLAENNQKAENNTQKEHNNQTGNNKPENKPKQTEKQEQAESAEKDNALAEKPKPTENNKLADNNTKPSYEIKPTYSSSTVDNGGHKYFNYHAQTDSSNLKKESGYRRRLVRNNFAHKTAVAKTGENLQSNFVTLCFMLAAIMRAIVRH